MIFITGLEKYRSAVRNADGSSGRQAGATKARPHRICTSGAHTKWGSASLPTPTIRFCSAPRHRASSRPAFLAISGPQNEVLRHDPEQSGGGLVGPLSGAGRTWKALHHLFHAPVETVAAQAMDCISCTRSGSPQLVGIAAFRDQAIDRFLRQSDRSLLAGLATTLDVPEVRRLCRPMIES